MSLFNAVSQMLCIGYGIVQVAPSTPVTELTAVISYNRVSLHAPLPSRLIREAPHTTTLSDHHSSTPPHHAPHHSTSTTHTSSHHAASNNTTTYSPQTPRSLVSAGAHVRAADGSLLHVPGNHPLRTSRRSPHLLPHRRRRLRQTVNPNYLPHHLLPSCYTEKSTKFPWPLASACSPPRLPPLPRDFT